MYRVRRLWSLLPRDKHGGHTIFWSPIAQNPMIHVNFIFMALSAVTTAEVLPIKVLHWGNREFCAFFVPVTSTLTRWNSYTNLTLIPWDILADRKWTFYVNVFESYRITYRQTDRRMLPKTLLRRFDNYNLRLINNHRVSIECNCQCTQMPYRSYTKCLFDFSK